MKIINKSSFSPSHKAKPPAVNYLFFGLFFVVLVIIHGFHVAVVESQFSFSRLFFLLMSIGQCLVEALSLIWIASWLQLKGFRIVKHLFSMFVFVLLLSHMIDFFLERLLDFSIWHGFAFMTKESLGNFFEILQATNIPLSSWALYAIVLISFVVLGAIGASYLDKLSKKKPIHFSHRLTVSFTAGLCCLLFLWDSIFSPLAQCGAYPVYMKALPWKTTFFTPRPDELALAGSLKTPWSDKECFATLDSRPFSLQRKPDIFLFITESLRDDFITKQVAPNLSQFRKDNIDFSLALSNANATHISWFSLFYSLFPFHWQSYQGDQWKKGSVPLILLKKMGYDIRLYSSSRLNFYHMDEMLFGENKNLLTSAHCFGSPDVEPCDSDALAIGEVCKDLKREEKRGGRVFIVFLESSHFGYSWPKEHKAPFTPYEENINYLEAAVSKKKIEQIKNRYRNALHHIDSLFGQFLSTLKSTESWEDSVIVFTADHGEEFFEYGHLFHATELSEPQLHVPLYYKMGSLQDPRAEVQTKITCHMDIFPSIFHYLIGEDCFQEVLQGQSIFSSQYKPFVVGARYNASKSPFEFYIHNGAYKLIAQFANKEDVLHSKSLHILATKDEREETVTYTLPMIRQQFGEALDSLFAQ